MAAAVGVGMGALSLYQGYKQQKTQDQNYKDQKVQNDKNLALIQQQMGNTNNPTLNSFQSFLDAQNKQGPAQFGQTYTPTDVQTAMVDPSKGGYNASLLNMSQFGNAAKPINAPQVDAAGIDPGIIAAAKQYQAGSYNPTQIDLSQFSLPQLSGLTGQDALMQFLNRDPTTQFDMSPILAQQNAATNQQANALKANVSSLGQRAGTASNIGQAMLRSNLTSQNNASNAQLMAQLNESQQNRVLQAAQTQSQRGVDLAGLQQQGNLAMLNTQANAMGQNAGFANQAGQFNTQMGFNTNQLNQQALDSAQAGRLSVAQSNQQAQMQARLANQQATMQGLGMDQQSQQFMLSQMMQGGLANAGFQNQALQFGAQNSFAAQMANAQAQNQMGQFNAQQGLNAFGANLNAFNSNTQAQQAFQQMMLSGYGQQSSAWGQQQQLQNQLLGMYTGQQVPQQSLNQPLIEGIQGAFLGPKIGQSLYGGGASGNVTSGISGAMNTAQYYPPPMPGVQYTPQGFGITGPSYNTSPLTTMPVNRLLNGASYSPVLQYGSQVMY